MLRLNYIPTWLVTFLGIGIIIGDHFTFNLEYLLIVILVVIILLIISYFKSNNTFIVPIYFSIITFILFLIIGISTITLHIDSSNKKHYSNLLKKENQLILQIDKTLKPNLFYKRYWANIIQLNGQNIKGKILVNILKDSMNRKLKVDDIIFTKCKIFEINSPLNPYEFDFKGYLQKKQIYYQIKLKNHDLLFLDKRASTTKGLSSRVRNKINLNLQKFNFTEDQFAIINALLLGQRQEISTDLYENYKNAGAVHILAISGLHIGIILFILNFLLKPIEIIKNGKNIKLIILIFFLWAFAFLSGLSASVVRAVTMFTAIVIGLLIKRRTNGNNNLIISMFFLLLFHPVYLFDVGFQLSYLAVFFIINLQPKLAKVYQPKQKIVRYFWLLFTVTIAAQIGVLPLSLFYFHQFPSLFFISSMVIIPFLGIILGIGFLIILLALFEILPIMFFEFYGSIINALNSFVAFISHQESFIFQNISLSFILTITIYFILIFGLKFLKNKSLINIMIILLSIIILQGILIYEKYNLLTTNEFIIFNTTRNTLITDRKNSFLTILHDIDKETSGKRNRIKNYRISIGNSESTETKTLKNILTFDNKKMLIIDSTAVYSNYIIKPEYLLLRQSPKINLERILIEMQPETVIVDGSNYRSFIKKWEKTSKKQKINFYNTSKNGAFIHLY